MSEKVTCFFSLQELEKRKGSGLPIGQKDKKDKKKNKLMKDIMAARELQAYEEQKEEVNVPYNVIFVSRPHTLYVVCISLYYQLAFWVCSKCYSLCTNSGMVRKRLTMK